jgi:hypothetical protein
MASSPRYIVADDAALKDQDVQTDEHGCLYYFVSLRLTKMARETIVRAFVVDKNRTPHKPVVQISVACVSAPYNLVDEGDGDKTMEELRKMLTAVAPETIVTVRAISAAG